MKLLVVLSVIACGYAAKLDRTYLPPASAATAGGSPGSLNAPVGPSGSGGFGQSPSGFGQPAANSGFGKPAANTGFGQPASFGSSNGPAGKSLGSNFGSQPSAPSGQYGQPGAPSGGFDAGFGAVAQNFGSGAQDYQRNQPQRSQAAADQGAQILRSDSQNDGETFAYSFETSNGIAAEESGVATNGVQAQGAFSYSDDDGQNFRVTYTADENGYQPQGDHLPTPHPIPEDILKSIEKNAQAAAAGTQEGAYNPNEDNSVNAPTQYNYNAPTSYNQGPSGSGSNQQGNGPSQLYGAPNAGSAPRSQPSQGFQPQGPSQQYGAPNAGSARPTNFGKSQGPSQNYGAPSNVASGASSAPQTNSYSQNQAPAQQYGAPSRPGVNGGANSFVPLNSGSNGIAPSGPASQPRPNQYQAPQSGFPSAGRPQGRAQAQPQDESGYQYDRPQGSFGQASNGRSSNQGSAGQYRPQSGATQPSGPQGSQGSFPRPNGPSGRAQGFAPSNGPSSQGSFGPSAGGKAGSFGPSAGSQGPSSFGPSAGSTGQGYPAAGQGHSGSNGQSSFGPSSNGNGFGRQQGSFPGAGAGGMADSGYTYNRPGSQSGAGTQAGSGSQPQFGSNAGSRPGQDFSGPRQPPSFSEEEGYKY